jgi:hypothetical protein
MVSRRTASPVSGAEPAPVLPQIELIGREGRGKKLEHREGWYRLCSPSRTPGIVRRFGWNG